MGNGCVCFRDDRFSWPPFENVPKWLCVSKPSTDEALLRLLYVEVVSSDYGDEGECLTSSTGLADILVIGG